MVPSEPHLASGGHDDSSLEFAAEHRVDAGAEGAFLDAMARLFAEDLRRLAGATARRPLALGRPLSIAALLLLARQIALLLRIP